MKPWLFLLLMAASPGEGCDMAQKPILYPGSVLSRNSQMRQAALQGEAYAPNDARVFNHPNTITDKSAITIGAFPGAVDTMYLARVKGIIVGGDVASLSCLLGTGVGRIGMALYELQFDPVSASMTFVLIPERQGWADISGGGGAIVSFPKTRPYEIDPRKGYAFGVVTTVVTANAYYVNPFNSLQYDPAVTETTGFPERINTNDDTLSNAAGTRVYSCTVAMRYGGTIDFY